MDMSLRAVPSLDMVDPYEFKRDGVLIARLSRPSKLGQFTAYDKMEVTAEGRRRGYFHLECGQFVHTPHSKLEGKIRVQLPVRSGMVCKILLGERNTGAKKRAARQAMQIYVERLRYARSQPLSGEGAGSAVRAHSE